MKNLLLKELNVLFLLFTITSNLSSAQSNLSSVKDSGDFALRIGEELTYIVKYAFLILGEVRFKANRQATIDERPVTEIIAYIDSYDGLPFVNLHQVYYSYIDESFLPVKFLGLMLEEDTSFVRYIFRRDSTIDVQKGNYSTGRVRFDSTFTVNKNFQDGLSILYYTRRQIGNRGTFNVPCFVNEKEENTIINFYEETEPVEINAADYEIDCKKIDGKTDFVSVFGLTGHFEGWFSNDKYAVPILAKMNVIIGNITLELIKWNKIDWNPPKVIN